MAKFTQRKYFVFVWYCKQYFSPRQSIWFWIVFSQFFSGHVLFAPPSGKYAELYDEAVDHTIEIKQLCLLVGTGSCGLINLCVMSVTRNNHSHHINIKPCKMVESWNRRLNLSLSHSLVHSLNRSHLLWSGIKLLALLGRTVSLATLSRTHARKLHSALKLISYTLSPPGPHLVPCSSQPLLLWA